MSETDLARRLRVTNARMLGALLTAFTLANPCYARETQAAKAWKSGTVLEYLSGPYQTATVTRLNTWNWEYGSSATITTTPTVTRAYEAIGIGTCNRAFLLFRIVYPAGLLNRRPFVGPLSEGETVAYRWARRDKVQVKFTQDREQREFTIRVFKVFDWSQVKLNRIEGAFLNLVGSCPTDTPVGKLAASMFPNSSQSGRVAKNASMQQNTSKKSKSRAALTNEDVSTMISSGLSPSVVIAKIDSSSCNFDTSPHALEKLKQSGVPNSVILVMVKKAAAK